MKIIPLRYPIPIGIMNAIIPKAFGFDNIVSLLFVVFVMSTSLDISLPCLLLYSLGFYQGASLYVLFLNSLSVTVNVAISLYAETISTSFLFFFLLVLPTFCHSPVCQFIIMC